MIAVQCTQYFQSFPLTFKINSQCFNIKKSARACLPSSTITLLLAFDVLDILVLFWLLSLLSFFPSQVPCTCCSFAWNALPLLLHLLTTHPSDLRLMPLH